jgi:threonine synthase
LEKDSIKYYSTNRKAPEVSFGEALLKGLAPDGGLYVPDIIPSLGKEDIESLFSLDYPHVAYRILNSFLSGEIESKKLLELCLDAYNFDIPVEKIFDRTYILRLDQGPTLSFKDFAARMMARLMSYYISIENRHFTILTATSGDTGSAVANAFYGIKNIDVIVLFPAKEITGYQRKQMTTLNKNIKAVAINGKFDDCQRLVKKAFLDVSLSECCLTSANSINIGRLLPQSVYYFYSWSRIAANTDDSVIFSVPSGNYGNLMGGILARNMGLPVKKFIISANENDEVPKYLQSGIYNIIDPSINCISSAMNVGHPSNMARIIALYGGMMNREGEITESPDFSNMIRDFAGFSITDEETRKTIAAFYKNYGRIIEPHGAVAWRGMEMFREKAGASETDSTIYISLETAHPSKFRDEIVKILGISPDIPVQLSRIENIEENFTELENDYSELSNFILKQKK